MAVGDTLTVDVLVTNLHSQHQTVTLYEIANDSSLKVDVPSRAFRVNAGTTVTQRITITALRLTETASIKLLANSTLGTVVYEAKQQAALNIVNKGGVEQSFTTGGYIGPSNRDRSVPSTAEFTYTIPTTMIDGSSVISAKIYSSNIAIFDETIEALMKEPQGNFEQVSATTYPLIMIY